MVLLFFYVNLSNNLWYITENVENYCTLCIKVFEKFSKNVLIFRKACDIILKEIKAFAIVRCRRRKRVDALTAFR